MRRACKLPILIVMLALFACRQPVEPAGTKIAWTAKNSIVAYGTSLTAGIIEPDSSYPAFLGEKLLIAVVNRGRVGATSAWGVANIDTIYAAKPVLVLLEFGANDFLQQVNIDTAAQNIAWMIEQIQANGAEVALLNFAHPDMYERINDNKGFIALLSAQALQAFIALGLAYDAMIDSLAVAYDLEIEDYLYEGIAWNEAYLTADWIHPNAAGNSLMAGNVFDAFKEIFEQSDMVK
ncbi:MAG: hypothetical protein IID15_07005 [Candidatus Marinimicrobia bacterium]|nr:hypothetical protein [Candidatus Neomarinimicrobiota bacterium]